MQNHYFGISPDNFQGNPSLSSFFDILTTSADKNRKTYVSTIQSKRYPVTAFQWHPEKNAFEWGSSEIPHSEEAIQVTQHAANYLVSEARKSMNRPSSEKVLSNLIYNYKPTYSGYKGSSSSSFEMWSYAYVWLPLVLSVYKDSLIMAKASEFPAAIFLPSQTGVYDSPRSSVCSVPNPNLNYKPVIGILSHPGDGASGRLNNDTNASYIAASYVKLAEAGGARVIPLIYNDPEELLFKKLELVNGVIFTGGWAKEGLYYEIVKKIFNNVLERNDAGEHFPLYAICLGFELLTMIISQNTDILEKVDAKNSASSLQFVENVNINGTIFQRFPPELLKKLGTDCLVMQNHQYGISPGSFEGNIALSNFFNIVTTCTDDHSKAYVSTVQSKNYPVTGFQWHPEKNAFEWGLSSIPHSEDAIQVTQLAANYLVSEARKSKNRPQSEKVLSNLIYNYKSTYCGYAGRGYDEVYIFTQQRSLL